MTDYSATQAGNSHARRPCRDLPKPPEKPPEFPPATRARRIASVRPTRAARPRAASTMSSATRTASSRKPSGRRCCGRAHCDPGEGDERAG